jgi:tetratricopeptide (TPR) repeat protein
MTFTASTQADSARFKAYRTLCRLFLGLFLLFPLAVFGDNIVLSMTQGDVQVLPAGRATPIKANKGQVLRSGDRVYTGHDGWSVLLIPDGSRVVLTANSEFMLRAHDAKRRSGTFSLITGMLRAMIPPSSPTKARYRFSTPTSVAGLRGTDFSMIHRGQANVFFGNSGKVEVQGLNTAVQPLTAATVVQTTRGIVPTEPIQIEANSQLAQAQALLNAVTDEAPASWIEASKLPEIIARWNITYSRYLADAGKHEDALHLLQIALDLTDAIDIQADARLERGAVFSRVPEGAAAAVEEYASLLNSEFTGPQREIALYMTGMGQYQLNRTGEAHARLLQYLHDYPNGRYQDRVETLLRSIEKTLP